MGKESNRTYTMSGWLMDLRVGEVVIHLSKYNYLAPVILT